MPRLLIICAFFPPSTRVGRERPWSLARYLPSYSWQVVVATKAPRNRDVDYKMLGFLPEGVLVHHVSGYQGIDWLLDGNYRRKLVNLFFGFPDSYRLWVDRLTRTLLPITRQLRPDVILTTSPPNSVHLAGMNLAEKLSCKWVADFRDAWIGNRLSSRVTNIHTCFSKKYYEKVIQKSDLLIANNSLLKLFLINQYPQLESKIFTVPIGYDEDLFSEERPFAFKKRLSEKIWLYSGGLYDGRALRALEQLCATIDTLPQENKLIPKIYCIGELSRDYQPRYLSGPYGLGHVDYTSVPSYLFGADGLILVLPQQERGSARVLLKAYGYARTQRPVLYIGPKNATYDYLRSRATVGQFDHTELPEAVRWMLEKLSAGPDRKVGDLDIIRKDSFKSQACEFAKILSRLVRGAL